MAFVVFHDNELGFVLHHKLQHSEIFWNYPFENGTIENGTIDTSALISSIDCNFATRKLITKGYGHRAVFDYVVQYSVGHCINSV